MSITSAEIATQPDDWRRAAELAPGLAGVLPGAGETVAVVGCGTSLYMAQAYAALREAAGQGRTDAYAASEVPPGRTADVLLVISRSGTTSEVLHTLASGLGTRSVALTAVAASPVAEAADAVVVLDFADERSVVQTRFATTVLSLLRAHLGHDVGAAADDAQAALAAPLPVDAATVEQWTFVGRGWTVALASEAALKLREAAQAWTESYPALEYRHGPMSITGPGSVVWSFGPLDRALATEVRATDADVVIPGLDPLAELVLAQRVAVAVAEAKGLNPDTPRNLTRSVVLVGEAAEVLS